MTSQTTEERSLVKDLEGEFFNDPYFYGDPLWSWSSWLGRSKVHKNCMAAAGVACL